MTDSPLQTRWRQLAHNYTEDKALISSLWRKIEQVNTQCQLNVTAAPAGALPE